MAVRRRHPPTPTAGDHGGGGPRSLRRGCESQQHTNIICVASLVAFSVIFGLLASLVIVVRLDENVSSEIIQYFVHLDDQDYHFPVYLSKDRIDILRSPSRRDQWPPVLADTIIQFRPHILGIKPWACMCCGRPARTYIGSPGYAQGVRWRGQEMIWDPAPFILCGAPACEQEAKRRTNEILEQPDLQQWKREGMFYQG